MFTKHWREKYGKPFVVAGFEPEHLLAVIYDIVRQTEHGDGDVRNLYKNAVRDDGNAKALAVISEYFEPGEATWRGLGKIPDSGLYLKPQYAEYDGGSRGLDSDMELPGGLLVRKRDRRKAQSERVPDVRQRLHTASSVRTVHGFCGGRMRHLVSVDIERKYNGKNRYGSRLGR